MPKFKTKKEATEWGLKMKKAREAKRAKPEPKPKQPSHPLAEIIKGFFPKASIKITPRDFDYSIEIIFGEGDVRSKVVARATAQVDVAKWCQQVKDNLEGKTSTGAVGIEPKEAPNQKIPSEIGQDKEFFFRAD